MYCIYENGKQVGRDYERYEVALCTLLTYACMCPSDYPRAKGPVVLGMRLSSGEFQTMARVDDGNLTYLGGYFA